MLAENKKQKKVVTIKDKMKMKFKEFIAKEHNSFFTDLNLLNASLQKGIIEDAFILVYSKEGCGKTTLSLQIANSFLKKYGIDKTAILYIDNESATSEERIASLINCYDLSEINFTHLEGIALDSLEGIVNDFCQICMEDNIHGLIIWDSIKQTPSFKKIASGISDSGQKAVEAQMLSIFFEKLPAKLRSSNVTIIAINQLMKNIQINVYQVNLKGAINTNTTDILPRGESQRFVASQALLLNMQGKYELGNIIGNIIRIFPEKNKIGAPRRIVDLILIPEIGFSDIVSNVEFLIKNKYLNVAEKGWIEIGDKKFRKKDLILEICSNKEIMVNYLELLKRALKDKYRYVGEVIFNEFEAKKLIEMLTKNTL